MRPFVRTPYARGSFKEYTAHLWLATQTAIKHTFSPAEIASG
jgi:hypothetical protein